MWILLSIAFLVLGSFFINGGINIIRKKEVYRFTGGKYRWSQPEPVKLRGKQAVSQGMGYILGGGFFIIASAWLFLTSL
jgi:hypothetical protein